MLALLGSTFACAEPSPGAKAGATAGAVAEAGADRPAGELTDRPIRIGWSLWPGYSPFVVARQRGLLAEHAPDIEAVFYDTSAKQMPDYEAGTLDGGFFALADAVALASRTRDDVTIVLICDNSDGADVIVAAESITDIADLRGRRIGTGLGSFGELLVRRMLASEGLTPADVTLINLSAERAPQALGAVVDAAQTWDPFASEAVRGGARRLFSSAQTPGLIADVLVVRPSLLAERRGSLQGLLHAWFQGYRLLLEEPEAATRDVAQATGRAPEQIGFDGIKLLSAADNVRALSVRSSERSAQASAEENLRFLLERGDLSYRPSLEPLFDPSLIEEVARHEAR